MKKFLNDKDMRLYYWHSMQTYEWKWWKICKIVKCLGSNQFQNYHLDQNSIDNLINIWLTKYETAKEI